jgi:hypothetical protein
MIENKYLLSDEFVEFSSKIAKIHQEKKERTLEFKQIYADYEAKTKELEQEAKKFESEFETWMSSQKDEKPKKS